MFVIQCPSVICRKSFTQTQNIRRTTSGTYWFIINYITRKRLHKWRRMRIISTKLSPDSQVLNRSNICKNSWQQLIFFMFYRVICHPLNRVLSCPFPSSVIFRSQRAISIIRIPVRQHKAWTGNRSIKCHIPFFSLRYFLISHHRIGTYFQPVAGFYLRIGTHVITTESWTLGNTVLIVKSSWDIVVQTIGSTVNRQFITLQWSAIIKYFIQPINICTRKQIIILTCVQANFLFKLDTLRCIHHHPVIIRRQLWESPLSTQCYFCFIHCQPTFGSDYNHTIRCTGTINRGWRSVFQYRDGLYISRTDRIKVSTGNRHTIQNKQRCRTRINWIRTSNLENSRLTRFSRVRDYR